MSFKYNVWYTVNHWYGFRVPLTRIYVYWAWNRLNIGGYPHTEN